MLWGIWVIAFATMFVSCLFGWWKLFIIATIIWIATAFIIRLLWDRANK